MAEVRTVDRRRSGSTASSSVDAITERVRRLISDRGLASGDALPAERDLAELFGVSRNTVRESLRALEAYGVIERGRRGAVISNLATDMMLRAAAFQIPFEREAFIDVQAFRHVVEVGLAPAILANITPADIAGLRRLNTSILDDVSIDLVAERDLEFHVTLMRCSGNKTVVKVLSALSAQLQEIMGVGKDWEGRLITVEGHGRILDALESRSLDALVQAFDRHFDDSLRNVRGSSLAARDGTESSQG